MDQIQQKNSKLPSSLKLNTLLNLIASLSNPPSILIRLLSNYLGDKTSQKMQNFDKNLAISKSTNVRISKIPLNISFADHISQRPHKKNKWAIQRTRRHKAHEYTL